MGGCSRQTRRTQALAARRVSALRRPTLPPPTTTARRSVTSTIIGSMAGQFGSGDPCCGQQGGLGRQGDEVASDLFFPALARQFRGQEGESDRLVPGVRQAQV